MFGGKKTPKPKQGNMKWESFNDVYVGPSFVVPDINPEIENPAKAP